MLLSGGMMMSIVTKNKIIAKCILATIVIFGINIASAEEFEFKKIKPTPEIVEQAKSNPNSWVYIIDGDFQGTDEVPQHAIVGSWQVDEKGEIMKDSFLANPNYKKIIDPLNSI